MKKLTVTLLLCVLAAGKASADGGMWMVNLIDKALALKMQDAGMKFDPSLIYNEASPSFTDAVVYFDQGCTGSMISGNGLVMTTHHCAYSDIGTISSGERNYLEDGFWAMNIEEERPIPGKKAMLLRYIIDVTDDVAAYADEAAKEGKHFNFYRMRYLMEKAVRDETGYEAELSAMWRGEKYYMSLYEVYTDIRLVAAPPVGIASFGGDVDNWEWPQHKGDFAIYRIYTAPDGSPAAYSPDNVPLNPHYSFRISSKGYSEGDFTLIVGYPSTTHRYSSSFAVKDKIFRVTPVTSELEEGRMKIMDKYMSADSLVRLKYYNTFFKLGNILEYELGEAENVRRYHILDSIDRREDMLRKWIEDEPSRKARWGSLLEDLREKYALTSDISTQALYFRETMLEGTGLYPYVRDMAVRKHHRGDSPRTVEMIKNAFEDVGNMWGKLDPAVEKELLEYAISEFYSHVNENFRSPFHEYLLERFGDDYGAMTDYIWSNSFFTDKARYDSLAAEVSPLLYAASSYEVDKCNEVCDRLRDMMALYYDPLYQLFRSYRMYGFYTALDEIENGVSIDMLEDEYARALYLLREDMGVEQYPDANSTVRFSYGNVSSLSPRDAVTYSWMSTTDGIVQKYSSGSDEYNPGNRFMELVRGLHEEMTVDFLTDNDVAKGNSGSPVLNADGELIGIAFDANQESLAGDLYYLEDCNKTVCADIRYVIWILEEYAGMDWLIDEMDIVE